MGDRYGKRTPTTGEWGGTAPIRVPNELRVDMYLLRSTVCWPHELHGELDTHDLCSQLLVTDVKRLDSRAQDATSYGHDDVACARVKVVPVVEADHHVKTCWPVGAHRERVCHRRPATAHRPFAPWKWQFPPLGPVRGRRGKVRFSQRVRKDCPLAPRYELPEVRLEAVVKTSVAVQDPPSYGAHSATE